MEKREKRGGLLQGPLAHAFPEAPEPPDPADTGALVGAADAFGAEADLAAPNSANPAAEAVLEPLALDGALTRHERGAHPGDLEGATSSITATSPFPTSALRGAATAAAEEDALGGQDAALSERLGRGAVGQAAREPDRGQVAREPARHLCRARLENTARDELRQRWARR